ncbi:MAG: biliverdin-producing heme oxygenase [Phycisphaerae bacterium]|nr:biliverdin-producing heme oxygenase [Gemmatimonadaceae bacterium]
MTTPDRPLSHRLRTETKEAHTTAERSGIMRDVLRGVVSRDAYVALLVNLRALYNALEVQLDAHQHHAALASVNWAALKRTAALDSDINRFSGKSAGSMPLEPSTHEYVQHLHDLGAHSPAQLFPHAYLRYLGDLYGGQIMKRILAQAFPEYESSGFSFYTFETLGDAESFKAQFRQAIDVVPEAMASADSMVAEAQRGYALHAAMFTEIASDNARWRDGEAPQR